MSARLPGTSQSNPTRYRGYEIALASYSPAAQFDWEAVHEDYGGDGDGRCIRAASVEACRAEIDERIDEGFDDPYAAMPTPYATHYATARPYAEAELAHLKSQGRRYPNAADERAEIQRIQACYASTAVVRGETVAQVFTRLAPPEVYDAVMRGLLARAAA